MPPDQPTSSLQSLVRMEGDSFEDALRNEVQNAPWWLVSLAIHAVILFILALLTISTAVPEEETYKTKLADKLSKTLGDLHVAVTAVGESRTRLRLAGPRARDLLAKGCAVDFHTRIFGGPGTCVQTQLAKSLVVLHLVSEDAAEGPVFDIFVLRSFADYLWSWLEDAAGEYGFAVCGG